MVVDWGSVFVGRFVVLFGWMLVWFFFFFFKQKTAYEIGTGDWSSDVCSSDLHPCCLELCFPVFLCWSSLF